MERTDPAEVDSDVLWMSPWEGVSGMSNLVEALEQNQDMLESCCLSVALGMPGCPLRGGQGGPDLSAWAVAPPELG